MISIIYHPARIIGMKAVETATSTEVSFGLNLFFDALASLELGPVTSYS